MRLLRNLLSNEYKVRSAVDKLNFKIDKGEIVGFIGKNGAGKSTTIKMLSGILQPTSGSITVNGINPYAKRMENAKQIGVVFGQKTQLWWDVPLIESFNLLKKIYKIDDATYKRNLDFYVPLLELQDNLNKPVRQMSLGQRVKSDIVAAMLHNPQILFLDEPTIGVDIVSKKFLHEFIAQVNREKETTILLTTHDMGDIEKLCSRVIVIDDGRKMYDGSLEQMIEKYGAIRTIMIELEENTKDFEVLGAKLIKSEKNKKWFAFNRFEHTPTQLIHQIDSNYVIKDLQVIEPEIESIVRNLYG